MKKSFTRLLTFAFLALAVSGQAFAQQKAGDVAKSVFAQLTDFADLATAGAFLVGIFMGILSLMKFKSYNENPQQTKISTPIILAVVAAGLIGLPAYLNMTKSSVLEGSPNSMNTNTYQSIGK
jgi:hypothetical protein